MIRKVRSFGKKMLHGDSLIKIKYSKEEWDQQYDKGRWNFLLHEQANIVLVVNELKKIQQENPSQKLRVLDVGCGNGALGRRLSAESFEYIGTDISDVAIEEAKVEVPWGTFHQWNMDEPPQDTSVYDVIVFCEVLIYGNYETILEHYTPLLKPEGLLVISLYDVWRTKIIWRTLKTKVHVLNAEYVYNKIRDIGWNVVVVKIKK